MKRIVIKVGTSSLIYPSGKANIRFIDHLARQISDLRNRNLEIILVSSGAIGVGLPVLGFDKKPDYIPYKQAIAAVGQNILMNLYSKIFQDYGQTVGQLLFTKGDALNSKRYMHMKGAISALFELGVIPIVNENDAVSIDEIKIGDNDTLSAMVASIAEADLLVILSDIQGLFTHDPRKNPNAELIREVSKFSRNLFKAAGGAGTPGGTGGMYTKLQAAEICVHSGIDMIIAESGIPGVLEKIADGEPVGTFFKAENVHPQMKRREIIIGSAVKGKIYVDRGCKDALLYKGSSLLPVGVISTSGDFDEGDAVSIYCDKEEFARGITHYSRNDIDKIKGLHTTELIKKLGYPAPYDTVIHRDNLFVMH